MFIAGTGVDRGSEGGGNFVHPMSKFLVGHFTVFGFDFQNWMPMMLGAVTIYVFYLWKTGQL
jgi:hypothetical protein